MKGLHNILKCYYDEKIVYPILILSESIFEMKQNGILSFSIPHLVPEIFRFLKYANEIHVTSFTHIDFNIVVVAL